MLADGNYPGKKECDVRHTPTMVGRVDIGARLWYRTTEQVFELPYRAAVVNGRGSKRNARRPQRSAP